MLRIGIPRFRATSRSPGKASLQGGVAAHGRSQGRRAVESLSRLRRGRPSSCKIWPRPIPSAAACKPGQVVRQARDVGADDHQLRQRRAEPKRPAFWIDGAIHANEIQATEVVLYTAWYLLRDAQARATLVTRLLDERTFLPAADDEPRLARRPLVRAEHHALAAHGPAAGRRRSRRPGR